MKNYIYIFLFLSITGCNSEKYSALIENNQSVFYGKEGQVLFVTLRSGETISGLAYKYNIPIKEIERVNSLDSYNNVRIGQILKIPMGNYYTIKEGDTLTSIGRVHDIDIKVLAEENGLFPKSEIYAGDYLRIPNTQMKFEEKQSDYKHVEFDNIEVSSDEMELDNKNEPNNEDLLKEDEKKEDESNVDAVKKGYLTVENSVAINKAPEGFYKNKSPGNIKGFVWPIQGKIIKKYGENNGKFNEGINIAGKIGTPVKAAARGEVVYIGKQEGYGNFVVLKHNNGYLTAYAHNDKIMVKKGQMVNQGTQIATIGKSGDVTAPQLQFSMKKGNHIINPDG